MQVKNVLMESWASIITTIYDEKNRISSRKTVLNDLKLPPCTVMSVDNGSFGSSNSSSISISIDSKRNESYACIPESIIASELRNKIETWTRNDYEMNNIDSNNNNNRKIDITSEKICSAIILSFIQIYNKYVSDDSAIYMINISSLNRKKLKFLFDSSHYYRTTGMDNDDNSSKLQKQMSLRRLSFKWGREERSQHRNMSFIKQELKDYLKESSKLGNNEKTHQDLIQWLLTKMLLPMDSALLEIIFLVNDSFTRFKGQNRQLFNQLCDMVET